MMDRKEVEVPREVIETMAAMAAEGGLVPCPAPIMAALCRTQLAVWDAPVGITEWDVNVLIVEFSDDEPAGWNQGQRVRIVPEGV